MRIFYLALFLFTFVETTFSDESKNDILPSSIIGAGEPLHGKMINYYPSDVLTEGYLSMPQGLGPHPSVILIHEWNGLSKRVKEVADSFAKEGYLAMAVDLYSGRIGQNRNENMRLVQETLAQPSIIIDNLNAAVQMLKSRDDSNGKLATIGWCYGGGVALSFAMGGDDHEGTAIFYGRLVNDPERLRHVEHDFYGTFARNDRGIPVAEVEQFVETLDAIGINNDVHIYDEVNHGFWLHVDRDPETNTSPAIDAWKRLKTFLHDNLSTSPL